MQQRKVTQQKELKARSHGSMHISPVTPLSSWSRWGGTWDIGTIVDMVLHLMRWGQPSSHQTWRRAEKYMLFRIVYQKVLIRLFNKCTAVSEMSSKSNCERIDQELQLWFVPEVLFRCAFQVCDSLECCVCSKAPGFPRP